ncbi:taste receptor type 2 member 9-like [Eublepharis macularius]|uniref:Taste receptor type 2 n=1 Tax=Eublepharis macularius TaxID=481883 RepID=A0AA97KR21_EUBMA|nr:taste receptor type 2 member 9-like [Eublepharis macularius]
MENQLFPEMVLYTVCSALELFAGIIVNGCIAVVLGIEWVRSRKLSSCDTIILSLALSRFCLQFAITLDSFVIQLDAEIFGHCVTLGIIAAFWMFSNHASLCFQACLSVFYFVKIADFTQSLFVRLKLGISKLVPWLLFSSFLYSLVTAVPLIMLSYIFSRNLTNNTSNNRAVALCKKKMSTILYLFYTTASIVPLMLFMASSSLLIISLWRHTRRMKQSSNQFSKPSCQAHKAAVKNVVLFLVIYMIYFVLTANLLFSPSLSDMTWTISLRAIVTATYPFIHSIALILSNTKLKQILGKMLHSGTVSFVRGI